MGRLEFCLLFFALDWHLASQRLLWVFEVIGEWRNRLVVASLRRVSGFEGLIVLNKWGSLWLGGAVRDRRVFLKNLFMSIERVSFLRSLREWLILHHGLGVFALGLSEVLGPVVVIFHVRDSSSKGNLLANLTLFDWIGANVGWHDDDVVRVLFRSIVLFNLHKVCHVAVRRRVQSLLNMRLRLERFLVSLRDLVRAVLLPH